MYFLFTWMSILLACMYVHSVCAWCPWRIGCQDSSDPLVLDYKMIAMYVLEIEPRSSARPTSILINVLSIQSAGLVFLRQGLIVTSLELTMEIRLASNSEPCLALPPESWNYGCAPPCPAWSKLFICFQNVNKPNVKIIDTNEKPKNLKKKIHD